LGVEFNLTKCLANEGEFNLKQQAKNLHTVYGDSSLIKATSMKRYRENFFLTAYSVHLSIPPNNIHMSFAHCRISYSE